MLPFQKYTMLLVVLLSCTAACVRADDTKYLPSGLVVVYSIDLAAVARSNTYQEMKKLNPEIGQEFIDPLKNLGVASVNISRLTCGASLANAGTSHLDFVVTTKNPIKAADIRAAKKTDSSKKNLAFTKLKVEGRTVYEESYYLERLGEPSQVHKTGLSFCVLDDKHVVFGDRKVLQEVFQRGRKPNVSPGVAAGLDAAGMESMLSAVADARYFCKMLPHCTNMLRGVDAIAIRINEGDQFRLVVTVFCKDEGSAKRIAVESLASLKDMLKDCTDYPDNIRGSLMEGRAQLEAVRMTTSKNQVTAEFAAEPVYAVQLMRALTVGLLTLRR